ncbi:MAG: ATP-binding protein, partial [Elusimicrobiota bacterium]
MKFRTKLTLGITSVLLGTTGAFLVFFLSLARNLATEKIEEKALALAQNLAANSSQAVYNEDLYKQLGPLLNGLLATPDAIAVSVRDASDRTLASAGAEIPAAFGAGWSGGGRGRIFVATAQIRSPVPGFTHRDKPIGSARVALSFERLDARIRSMLVRSLAFAALIIAAALGLAIFLANRLTRPMKRILEADDAVVRGDAENSDIPAAEIPADEIGRIMRSRAAMLSALRRAGAEQKILTEKESRRVVELEKAYLELKDLREQLTQAEKLSVLGQVLSGVAHEINNPLTGIMGFAELLLKEKLVEENPQVREDLASILHESVRCREVVKGLTVFARKHKPEKTYVSVNELIEQSLKLEASQLRTRNISVLLELDPGLPRTMADYHQLQQVFMNLFINAQQAMTEYKGGGRLTVRTRLKGSRIQAEVEDNGPGIPPENLPRVFDPFFTTKSPGKGTGLGLSLSYGIVSEHGGSIRVESPPGK